MSTKLAHQLLTEAIDNPAYEAESHSFHQSILNSRLINEYVSQLVVFCSVRLSQAFYQKAEMSVSSEEVVRFLGSRGGRHTADMLAEARTRPEMAQLILQNLPNIKKYFVQWRKEVRDEARNQQAE